MGEVRIRFRTDCWGDALDARKIADGGDWSEYDTLADKRRIISTTPARDGDCWESTYTNGNPAGYIIICPTCHDSHGWSTAGNCSAPRREYTWTDKDGIEQKGSVCIHSGEGSCWDWTGSGPEGTLTASPSLHCPKDKGGCGFHGWLQNGILRDC